MSLVGDRRGTLRWERGTWGRTDPGVGERGLDRSETVQLWVGSWRGPGGRKGHLWRRGRGTSGTQPARQREEGGGVRKLRCRRLSLPGSGKR